MPGLKIVGPDWLHSVPYSLHAKAAGPATRAELNMMLRSLLIRPILVPPPDSDLPSIFEALQAVGLKLESRQGNVVTYIVDHVERVPAEQ